MYVRYGAARRIMKSAYAYRSLSTAKCLPRPQMSGVPSRGVSQLPENVLLPSEGIFVPQRPASPDHGCRCVANTGAERKHEKLKKEGVYLGTIELKILTLLLGLSNLALCWL